MGRNTLRTLELCETDPRDLKPGHLAELVWRFGSLTSWWLHPRLLERVENEVGLRLARPRLPASHGSCWIVFAQQPPKRWPALRDAFVLPLQWQPNTPHSRRLPPKLAGLVKSVASQLDVGNWGLDLSPVLNPAHLDLSAIDEFLEVRSGWVSLAGGLLVATGGGKPDPAVWATGGWNEGGICRVDLGEKLGLAAEFGVRQFFVPESQLEEAKQVLLSRNCDTIRLGALFEGTVDICK